MDVPSSKANFNTRKLSPFVIDDVSNISIAPNSVSRLHFSTWGNSEDGQTLRTDAEIIMTLHTLQTLSDALPKALATAFEMIANRNKSAN